MRWGQIGISPAWNTSCAFSFVEGDVLFQFASEQCADVGPAGAMVLRQDLNTEGLHIVAGYLPELLVVLLGGW